MSIQASVILDEAAALLLDKAHRTWTADDLLSYLNEAMRTTAGAKADFYVVENPTMLVEGIVQDLPSDGIVLIDIPRNTYQLNSGGVNRPRVITQVDKTLLDEVNRFWPSGTQESVVEHFTFDPRNPRRYAVFPPNDGTGLVDLVYSATPPQIMYSAEELVVPDSYQTALLNFVMGKAYLVNSKRQDLAKSNGFMAQWGQLLGLKAQGQAAIGPKVSSEPGTA